MVNSCWQEDVFLSDLGEVFPFVFEKILVLLLQFSMVTVAASFFLSVFWWLKKFRLQRKT